MGLADALLKLVQALCGSSGQNLNDEARPEPFTQGAPQEPVSRPQAAAASPQAEAAPQAQLPPAQVRQDGRVKEEGSQPGEHHKHHGKKPGHKRPPGGYGQEHKTEDIADYPAPVHAAPSPPHQAPSPPHQRPHERFDANQANQHDPSYVDLRAKANQAGDDMARCFRESHEAYGSGDGARAKELSNEGKRHQAEMERINGEASAWIFEKNNEDSKPGEIDLHGLYVKEAIKYTDQSIEAARQRGDPEIHLIVGKGLHSAGHIAKLKPAIEELMVKHQLIAELDPHNSGVLIVHLDGRGANNAGAIGTDDIANRLERDDQQCVIM